MGEIKMNYEQMDYHFNGEWNWRCEPWPNPVSDKVMSQTTSVAIRRNRTLPMMNRTRGDVGLI
jgi:hypothetical protein